MRLSESRNGNFTSSEIYNLMTRGKSNGSFGAPAIAYIEEKNMERRLGRALQSEIDAKATSWGKLLERRAFDLLGLEYKLCSSETLSHPEIVFWKGSPDAEKFDEGKTVVDFKAPYTLKSFCQLIDAWAVGGIDAVRANYKYGEKFFYQLVSNAILTNAEFAELIVYCPYKSELEEIRKMSEGEGDYYWMNYSTDDHLPYLIDGGYYKNLNVMRFEVPLIYKRFLTDSVIEAGKLLIDYKPVPELM